MKSIIEIDRAIASGKQLDHHEVRQRLKWLQHERLVHLLVMLTTGIGTILVTMTVIITPSLILGVLAHILGILFGAYVLYYRKLELMIYRWYEYLASADMPPPSDTKQ